MLWLATHNGLDRLDPSSGRFTHYRNDPNDPHSLSSNDVRFVLEDRQGTLWVATAAGLDAFDRRTGRVLRYPNSQQPAIGPDIGGPLRNALAKCNARGRPGVA